MDEDPDGVLLAHASAEHGANVDTTQFIREFAYRDDGLSYDPDFTAPMIGPAYYADTINPDVAYYNVSGWMDAVNFANAATRRFLFLPVERKHLLLGSLDDGARTIVSPFRMAELPDFEEMGAYLRFFDQYLKGEEVGFGMEALVNYFAMIEEQWKAAASWPPP